MSSLDIALIADPHLSLDPTAEHANLTLAYTAAVTEAVMVDLERRKPDLAIWMGDLTHEGTDAVRDRFRELAQRLTVPCLWMLGNHDVEYISKRAFARQVAPCVFRQWMHAAGWELVVLDTVREKSPEDSSGQLTEPDRQLLHHAASANDGPMLVLAHHPLRTRYFDPAPFWEAVSPLTRTGVYIGAHSHREVHETEGNWHLLDVGSCSRPPFDYYWMTLQADALTIDAINVGVDGTDPEPVAIEGEPVYPVSIPATPVAAESA